MEKESQRLLESVMKLIAAQFGPDCEVVLHDWSKEYDLARNGDPTDTKSAL